MLRSTPLLLAGFLALLLALPSMLTNEYYVSVLILACINAIVAVSMNLLLGYAGQISMGHAAFYGLGAYGTAIATATWGLPMEAGLGVALLAALVVALAIGIPCLKLSGHYLAMATLGFGLVVNIVFNEALETTGGPSGFVGIPRLKLLGFQFDDDLAYYRLLAVCLTGMLLLTHHIVDSRLGRALRALHTSEKAAACAGVDVARHKLFVFVLSALMAAFAGFLYAHYLTFVAPSSFSFLYSVEVITMVVLGGLATLGGAVAGAFFLTILPEMLRSFENIEVLLYGGILVLCMMFMPGGLMSAFTGAGRRLGRLLARKQPQSGGSHGR
ncbi:branched-chain amino acid ABC transporter permease [Megalodesulfovibrio gigas]|uniref:Putative ABC transporter permease n=1 Tax=Megalodesulfovibrio gigas (strain ATCC 19364 / DSM 1382 / NCIMB 9332 / VKM B-1759) TaxID=1121448 RepID=T2GFE1_MEGG1|nr:branched-chain amino acid ABC transporter permease [Megalodesulfovibrio gigas]AGW14851.1 putative ABC transporter permease [Megalodesulfovibrio gigas DSM 1382 = ATCC 19364]